MYSFVVLVLLALAGIAEASHGRYGSITFTKDAANPLSVTFKANFVFRRSYFGAPNVGDTVSDDNFAYGDGNYEYIFLTVNAVNLQDDWIAVSWTGSHTYQAAGSYQVGWSSCCRIFQLNNNPSYSYAWTSTVLITQAEVARTSTVNNSPVSGSLPIINVPYGVVPYSYDLLFADPENDGVTFTLATAAQQGDYSSTQPPGLSVSSSGRVTLSQTLAKGYWTTQQAITDAFGNRISVDYLLLVVDPIKYCNGTCQNSNSKQCTSSADCVDCNSSCLTAVPRIVTDDLSSPSTPRTNLPAPAAGSVITIPANQATVVSFVVDDANLVNPSTPPYIYTSSVPSYGTVSAQMACTSANGCIYQGSFQSPQFINVTLSPTTADYGTQQIICVGAKSLDNQLPSQYCITININNHTAVCGNGIVEGSEDCDDNNACCVSCKVAQAGTVCRSSVGACDVAETCSGSSTTCPVDAFSSSNTICRASTGDCDIAETCTGSSSACPSDSFASSSTVCRASAGQCDVAESCTGSAASCPTDSFVPSTTVCRSAVGVCDAAETCTGSSASCPTDSFLPSTSVCRAAKDSCDFAEKCTGSSVSCPPDAVNTTTKCLTAAIVCSRQIVPAGKSGYFCSPLNTAAFYQCAGSSVGKMSCGSGTGCNCPYGVECSCGGNFSPCLGGGATPTC